MKWLKKHKDEIATGVKLYIIMHTMLFGFWLSYMLLWSSFDLPIIWWSCLITLALALLSLFGFCLWVKRGGDNG